MTDPSYPLLRVDPGASDRAVLRAAARLFHPTILQERGLRPARKRFYRLMLQEHARTRAATDKVLAAIVTVMEGEKV
ncbi:hypothetical protein D2T30_05625 [Sinirhodobacter populi]|uniref:Uncharacterized protein n=1 Tax=Paenirhodobacter populi TaxID=2306993 RepID=A0A443JRJ3_9RHOB|nr:hypothetical protein D2T30_05625 [Sinirhodobacter populi]